MTELITVAITALLVLVLVLLLFAVVLNIIDRFRNPFRVYAYLPGGTVLKTNVKSFDRSSSGTMGWVVSNHWSEGLIHLKEAEAVKLKDRRLRIF